MKRILLALSVAVLIIYACTVNFITPEPAEEETHASAQERNVEVSQVTPVPEEALEDRTEDVSETEEETVVTDTVVPLGKEPKACEE